MIAGRGLSRLALVLAAAAAMLAPGRAVAFGVMGCSAGAPPGGSRDADGIEVVCGGNYNLCGYRNSRGDLLIPQRFEVAFPFSERLAGVRLDGKFGFIDRSGKLVIPARFDLVGSFTAGIAEVVRDGKAGAIDRQGRTIVEPEHLRAMPFGTGAVLLIDGTSESRLRADCSALTDAATVLMGGDVGAPDRLYRIFDRRTRRLDPQAYRFRHFDDASRGLVWAAVEGTDSFGLLRSDSSWQVAPQYRKVSRLSEGFATACKAGGPREWIRYCGAVDEEGRLVVPLRFHGEFQWRTGLKLVRAGKQVGIVDTSGRLLGDRVFDHARLPEQGDISLVKIGAEWLGLDRAGNLVANPQDGEIVSQCPSGLRAEKRSGRVRLLGADGRPTEPHLFGEYTKLNCHGPTTVELDGKRGFVDTDGHLLGGLPAFDDTYGFSAGHAAVQLNGKWGIIDESGRYTVEPRFERLHPDGRGAFAAAIGERMSWIDGEGREVPEPSRAEDRAKVLSCGTDAGHFIFSDVGGQTLWGFAGPDGEVYLEPKYRALLCYAHGLAWVADDERRMWCQIDSRGVVRDPAACDPTFHGTVMFDAGPESFDKDPYESSVLWERALLDYGRGLRKHPPRIVSSTRF